MRIFAATVAALGLMIALPVLAAPLSKGTIDQAGITPDSPLSFFDQTLDAIAIALALSPESKVDASLAVAEERAAEAAVMMEKGDAANTDEAIAAVQNNLQIAVNAAGKLDAPEDAAPIIAQIEEAAAAAQEMLHEGIEAAPAEMANQFQAAAVPAFNALDAAADAVAQAVAAPGPGAGACSQAAFEGCLQSAGCTQSTSAACFRACPSRPAPCANPGAGKTCKVPDTTCVNTCLVALSGCFTSCLTNSHCQQNEVSTSSLQLVAPEEVQRMFRLELQNAAAQ